MLLSEIHAKFEPMFYSDGKVATGWFAMSSRTCLLTWYKQPQCSPPEQIMRLYRVMAFLRLPKIHKSHILVKDDRNDVLQLALPQHPLIR